MVGQKVHMVASVLFVLLKNNDGHKLGTMRSLHQNVVLHAGDDAVKHSLMHGTISELTLTDLGKHKVKENTSGNLRINSSIAP